MDQVYEIPVEFLTAAGANGRQYELQSKSWGKVRDFLRGMDFRAIHEGQGASDSVNNPIGEGRSSQVFGAGDGSGAGEYDSYMSI